MGGVVIFIEGSGKAFLIIPDSSESPSSSEGVSRVDIWCKESRRPAQVACLRLSKRPLCLNGGAGGGRG